MAERSIADIGRYLQSVGLRVGENPAFGGVGGGHSPTGYHPKGMAIDVTDWRPDMAPAYEGGKPISWKQRTGELSWRAKQLGLFNEALGPGDPGHGTHVHLALEGKKFITDPQLQWLATGRYKTPEGKLTDVMPMANPMASTPSISSENPGSVNTQQAVRRTSEEFLNDYMNQSVEAAILSNALNMNQPKSDPMAQFQQMFQQMSQTNLVNPLLG
jgi:hypothetical protein